MNALKEETIARLKSVVEKEVSELFDSWSENEIDEHIISAHAEYVENQITNSFKNLIEEYKNTNDPKTVTSSPTNVNKMAMEELEINAALNRELEETGSLIERNFNELVQKLQCLKDQRLQFMREVEALEATRNMAIKRAEIETPSNTEESKEEQISEEAKPEG